MERFVSRIFQRKPGLLKNSLLLAVIALLSFNVFATQEAPNQAESLYLKPGVDVNKLRNPSTRHGGISAGGTSAAVQGYIAKEYKGNSLNSTQSQRLMEVLKDLKRIIIERDDLKKEIVALFVHEIDSFLNKKRELLLIEGNIVLPSLAGSNHFYFVHAYTENAGKAGQENLKPIQISSSSINPNLNDFNPSAEDKEITANFSDEDKLSYFSRVLFGDRENYLKYKLAKILLHELTHEVIPDVLFQRQPGRLSTNEEELVNDFTHKLLINEELPSEYPWGFFKDFSEYEENHIPPLSSSCKEFTDERIHCDNMIRLADNAVTIFNPEYSVLGELLPIFDTDTESFAGSKSYEAICGLLGFESTISSMSSTEQNSKTLGVQVIPLTHSYTLSDPYQSTNIISKVTCWNRIKINKILEKDDIKVQDALGNITTIDSIPRTDDGAIVIFYPTISALGKLLPIFNTESDTYTYICGILGFDRAIEAMSSTEKVSKTLGFQVFRHTHLSSATTPYKSTHIISKITCWDGLKINRELKKDDTKNKDPLGKIIFSNSIAKGDGAIVISNPKVFAAGQFIPIFNTNPNSYKALCQILDFDRAIEAMSSTEKSPLSLGVNIYTGSLPYRFGDPFKHINVITKLTCWDGIEKE